MSFRLRTAQGKLKIEHSILESLRPVLERLVTSEQIRSVILDHSDVVVQDDSGVPLRDFARDTWTLQFHGRYEAPTPEFRKYLQKDLRIEIQRYSTGNLPFSYGYAYRQGESNLMIAERRQ